MQSFLEMCEIVENHEVLKESLTRVADIIDRIAGDAPEELRPVIMQIIKKGYKGGNHHLGDLQRELGPAAKHMLDALHYLEDKGAVRIQGDDTFQVSDINQFLGSGGSSLKGARTGALSRKMLGHGDAQKTHGEYGSKLDQVKAKYPKHAQTLQLIFASPIWKAMLNGKPARVEEMAPGVNMANLLAALEVLRHEEIVGFSGEPTPDTIVKARKFGDATEGDLDRAAKQFPKYAAIFQKIMKTGAWRRLLSGATPQAAKLLGVGATGGTHSADVEQQLKALMALKHMGIIHFEGDKPTLQTVISKGASEVEPENAFAGPSTATDAQRAGADQDRRLGSMNRMHGASAQEKMAPGKLASAAGMHGDDPTQAIAREWFQGWTTAMKAIERDQTLLNNRQWLGQLETQTMQALQNIATQIQQAIQGGADQSVVKPMMTNFFMVAEPRNSQYTPLDFFHGVHELANQVKSLYNGVYKRMANVPRIG